LENEKDKVLLSSNMNKFLDMGEMLEDPQSKNKTATKIKIEEE